MVIRRKTLGFCRRRAVAGDMQSVGTIRMSAMRKPKEPRDVITLADLSPRHEIKGGSRQRIFGADTPNPAWRSEMKTKLKDLPPKSPTSIKGGRAVDGPSNDNITLVRGAKPSKKRDLPPRKDVKGGKKDV